MLGCGSTQTAVNKLAHTILLPLIALFSAIGFAQEPFQKPDPLKLQGKISSILSERIYIVQGGRYVGEQRYRTAYNEYDENNKVVLSITYGNVGQIVARYFRDKSGTKIETTYLDKDGNPSKKLSDSFHANWNLPTEQDLCANYTIRKKKDPIGKIDRYEELCTDGSKRAEIVFEYGLKGEQIRFLRTDAKGRTWEGITTYDEKLNPKEYRYLVNDKKKAPYVQTVIANEIKLDETGNVISIHSTSFDSTRPGLLAFQYFEKFTITYRTNKVLLNIQK